MAEVDGRVLLLLQALRDGGAVSLADEAAEVLRAMQAEEEPTLDEPVRDGSDIVDADEAGDERDQDGSDDDEAPGDGEPRLSPAVARRQLELVDRVVVRRLRLEAALIDAVPRELEQLRAAQAELDDPGFVVEEVTIVDDGDAGRIGSDGREVPLFAEDAAGLIAALEQAWADASSRTRGDIDDGQ